MAHSKHLRSLAVMTCIFGLPMVVGVALHVGQVRSMAAYVPPDPSPTYVVAPGDTLWSIAREHYPDADPRAAVYAIQQLNDVDPGRLRPGDILLLPKEVR